MPAVTDSALFAGARRYRGSSLVAVALIAIAAMAPLAASGAERSTYPANDEVAPTEEGSTSESTDKSLPGPDAGLLELARKGEPSAQNRLGVMYLSGKVVPKNVPEGVKWVRAAAEQGLATAQLNLGTLYEGGVGVPKDYAEAIKWFRLSANQGNAGAENGLGFLYEHGFGVVQNFADAMTWYHKAIDQNNETARFNLAQMYDKGEGTAKDPAEAVKLFRVGADRGYAPAQILLGAHYLSGNGMGRDASLAYFWSALGASRAPANFANSAATLRDAAARQLKPEEVSRLQTLAAQWKPGTDVAALVGPTSGGGNGPAGIGPGGALSGTGFLVTKSGYLVTNAHVVPNCKTVTVRTDDSFTHAATVVNRDEHADLALLKADGEFANAATFREDRGIRQGDDVVAFGFPLVGLLTDQGILTAGTVSALAGLNNDTRLIQISAPVQPGSSGGPLVDSSGNVVGVIVSKLNAINVAKVTGDVAQNVNFAIKENVARDFLEANGVGYATAKSSREIRKADLATRLKSFTVLVLCNP